MCARLPPDTQRWSRSAPPPGAQQSETSGRARKAGKGWAERISQHFSQRRRLSLPRTSPLATTGWTQASPCAISGAEDVNRGRPPNLLDLLRLARERRMAPGQGELHVLHRGAVAAHRQSGPQVAVTRRFVVVKGRSPRQPPWKPITSCYPALRAAATFLRDGKRPRRCGSIAVQMPRRGQYCTALHLRVLGRRGSCGGAAVRRAHNGLPKRAYLAQ